MSVYPAPFLDAVGLYPDVLGDVRTWLRTHPYLTSLTGSGGGSLLNARVFFRIPDNAVFPLLRLYDAGTTKQPGEVPLVNAQVGIDVWGGSYGDVVKITRGVAAAFDMLPAGALIGATTVALNAESGTALDSPDPDTGVPRKVLTALVTARAVTANG